MQVLPIFGGKNILIIVFSSYQPHTHKKESSQISPLPAMLIPRFRLVRLNYWQETLLQTTQKEKHYTYMINSVATEKAFGKNPVPFMILLLLSHQVVLGSFATYGA